jgi:hypothetical protein
VKRRYLFDTGIAQDYQAGRDGIRERAIEERKSVSLRCRTGGLVLCE